MTYHKTMSITAITTMAVIFIGLFAGCATMKQANQIKESVAALEEQNQQTQHLIARMDSVLSATTENNRQLQNDVRYSTDQLAQQMSQLLESYNDLMTRINQMNQRQVITLPPTSSPGSQTDPMVGPIDTVAPPPGVTPDVDCIDTYDEAFTQTRRGEYEPAIETFRAFLAECPNHENSENAYYWIGECLYSLDQYSEAVTELQHLVDTYPDSPNLGRAYYKLARCHQELGHKADAIAMYRKLVDDYPGTFEAEKAAERLEELE